MTKKDTIQIMAILREVYPSYYGRKTKDELEIAVDLWAEMFAEYSAKVVAGAVKAFIATDTKGFPPSIGQIMEKVRKITEPEEMTESEAWALVIKAIRNSAYDSEDEFYKLPRPIRQVVHDPAQLKAWAIDDDFNEGVVSSNFMRSYRAKMQSAREFRAMPKDVQALAMELSGKLAMPDEDTAQLPEGVNKP